LCVPNRTKCILFIPVMRRALRRGVPRGPWGAWPYGPDALLCMPNRTKCILFIPGMRRAGGAHALPAGRVP
jgi:hypothetical protein